MTHNPSINPRQIEIALRDVLEHGGAVVRARAEIEDMREVRGRDCARIGADARHGSMRESEDCFNSSYSVGRIFR
jgi:hypothetical protein